MKIFKIIYYIAVLFIALVAALLIISVFPITGNYKIMMVQSGSMEPSIKTGSLVVVKPADNYKIDDIITFNTGGNKVPTTHRIYDIKVNEGVPFYITKGDANNAPDDREVSQKDIVGKVRLTIPFLGHLVDFSQKPIGFMLIIIVPALLIISDEIRKIFHEIKNKKMKEVEPPSK